MTVRALNIGVSGLRVESDAIGVAGDNIANVNTPGFKRQRAVFQDVFNRGSAGGSGARLQEIGQAFTQGSLSNTGVNTDVALNGDRISPQIPDQGFGCSPVIAIVHCYGIAAPGCEARGLGADSAAASGHDQDLVSGHAGTGGRGR